MEKFCKFPFFFLQNDQNMFHFTFDSNQVKNILSPRYFILHTISSTDIDILKTYSLEVKFTSQMEACCWRNSHGDDWFQQPCLFLFKTKLDLLFRLGRIFYKNPFSIVDRKHSIIQVFFLCLRCRVVHGRFLKTHSLEIIIVRKKKCCWCNNHDRHWHRESYRP